MAKDLKTPPPGDTIIPGSMEAEGVDMGTGNVSVGQRKDTTDDRISAEVRARSQVYAHRTTAEISATPELWDKVQALFRRLGKATLHVFAALGFLGCIGGLAGYGFWGRYRELQERNEGLNLALKIFQETVDGYRKREGSLQQALNMNREQLRKKLEDLSALAPQLQQCLQNSKQLQEKSEQQETNADVLAYLASAGFSGQRVSGSREKVPLQVAVEFLSTGAISKVEIADAVYSHNLRQYKGSFEFDCGEHKIFYRPEKGKNFGRGRKEKSLILGIEFNKVYDRLCFK